VKREEKIHPERNPVVRLFKRWMPVTSEYRGDRFFVRENGIAMATPLFVVLLLAHSPWKIDTLASLGVIVVVLAASVLASWLWPKKLVVKVSGPPQQ
jgi:tellurite resistance protein TerC